MYLVQCGGFISLGGCAGPICPGGCDITTCTDSQVRYFNCVVISILVGIPTAQNLLMPNIVADIV